MENTKALEVALDIRNKCVVFGDPHYSTRFCELSARALIQAAIDEVTADLRAQLAERDDKLAALLGAVDAVLSDRALTGVAGWYNSLVNLMETRNTQQ